MTKRMMLTSGLPPIICMPPVKEPRSTEIEVMGILQAHRVSGSKWTHLLMGPNNFRTAVVEEVDAKTLYRAFNLSYIQRSLPLMERCLCDVNRLSFEPGFYFHAFYGTCSQLELRGLPPFVSPEMYLANVTHNIVEILERKIDTTDLTPFHWTALVLRPHAVQEEISTLILFVYNQSDSRSGLLSWLHWPLLAVLRDDFNDGLCQEIRDGVQPGLATYITALRSRGRGTYSPMYGSDDQQMLVTNIFTRE